MSDIIGFDITPDSGSTLRKFLKYNLGPCMAEFENISVSASKVGETNSNVVVVNEPRTQGLISSPRSPPYLPRSLILIKTL